MKKFEVDVTRLAYSNRTLSVEAESEEEAYQVALSMAGDYDYSESSSEYEVMDVRQLKDI
jgi:hypothetical protein